MKKINKIGLGGGCHWCTEAVFQSLNGVKNVEQGFVASISQYNTFSEAVVVHFYPEEISLKNLIEVHLYTHKSTSLHSMRQKYRSAVYTFEKTQVKEITAIINYFQKEFDDKIITRVHPFRKFKPSREEITNYYKKNPEKPFCKTYIDPKLLLVKEIFSNLLN